MAKKSASSKGGGKKSESFSAQDHRKMSATLHAKARLHDAKADLMDAKNPPKKQTLGRGCY